MNYEIEQKVRALSQAHTRRKRWQRIVAVLAALTLLVTGYAMSLPALTKSATVCGLEEHVHGDDCYSEIRTLTCGLEEDDSHTHDDSCYTVTQDLTCEKDEHTHIDECYIDLDADVETAEIWERTVADVELTGVWADDLIAVAETQLNYEESIKNYYVNEKGEHKGYTRYGAWYGAPYADWSALFLAFCMNYAQIDADEMPVNDSPVRWLDTLTERDLFVPVAEGTAPRSGDLVFFDFDGDGQADQVGLVYDLLTDRDGALTKIQTVEGDSDDRVQKVKYDVDDPAIIGYGSLPENPEPPEAAEEPVTAAEEPVTAAEEPVTAVEESVTAVEEPVTAVASAPRTIRRAPAAATVASGVCGGCDWTLNADGLLVIRPTDGVSGQLDAVAQRQQWLAYKDDIKQVLFESGVKAAENSSYLFYECTNVTDIAFGDFDTSHVTNMERMFQSCINLKNVDVSGWDTSKVTTMGWMFNYCESLTNVDVSGFDTSNATTLTSMFQQCVCLEYVDVSGFDTSNVTDMAAMFNHCESLTNVDVSGFDTSNVWRMRIMFQRCDVLETLDVSGFDTSNVTDMVNMFYGCYVLTALDVSGFDTSKITNMKGIFGLCNGLTSLDLSGFDMTNCTNWEFFLEQERSLTKMVLPESFKTQGFGTAFPQGSWTCLENGETYSQFKWIDLLRDGGGAGTYIRESYHSLSMNAPLQYMINPVKSYAKFENVADVVCTGDFFYDPVDGRIYASMQDFEHMPDVYTVPGSVTVLMRDIVTDADDNVYDLKCTVDAVTYYGPALLSSRNYTHLNEQILSIGSNGYIYVVFNFFNDDRTFVGSGIVTKKQRITMQVMDKNGTPMEGYFCFGAHDLDNPSLCEIDNGYGGFRGLFSEGVNLVSGFDLDSLNYLAPENFGKICDMGYQPDLYEGYRLTGTANDSNSEASMFVVRASAAGATFDWTAGKDCGTDFAFDYQPEVFKLSKVTPIGNQLPGAKLSLYEVKDNGTENLLENWTSSADKTKNGWLTSGEYYLLKEVEAPAGYRMASDIHFQIDNDNKAHLVTIDPVTGAKTVSPESIDVISMIDEPMVGTVEITKYIKDTTTPLAGAEFSLTGTSSYLGEVSLTGTTDANGKCSFTVPLGGPYTVRETNPPDGYSSAPDQTVTVSTDYQRIALVFEDEPARTLTVKTTTVGGGNTEFPYSVKVTGTDGNPVILPANPAYTVNTTTGEITFRQRDGQSKAILKLPPDATVSIIETSHDGYTVTVKEGVRPLASEDTISVVMDTNRTVEFINNPGILLPNTGGGGSLFYTFGGTALAAFALMYGYSRRRKREGRSTL